MTDLLVSSLSSINSTAAVYEIGRNVSEEMLSTMLQTIKPRPDCILPYILLASGNATKRLLNKVS